MTGDGMIDILLQTHNLNNPNVCALIIFLGKMTFHARLRLSRVTSLAAEISETPCPCLGSAVAEEVVEEAFRLAVISGRPEEVEYTMLTSKVFRETVFHFPVETIDAVAAAANPVLARYVPAALVERIDRGAIL